MALFGQICLALSLVSSILCAVLLLAGHALRSRTGPSGERIVNAGYIACFATTLLLTICVALLLYGFFAGNYSIFYVLKERTTNTTGLAWLFKLAGLWAGLQGSLLFWAWLISIFASYIGVRQMHITDDLSNVAIAVMSIVLLAFLAILVFSSDYNPFQATPSLYVNADGSVSASNIYPGMNILLEHWAMALHPPALFIGYAGVTVPFAYAVAALVVNDPSKRWVELSGRVAVFSWLFLGFGIGLGAVWAYVVLGWGGYWGWDAVENASLLSWLVCLALIHSFTIYRKRGGFKRWAIVCAGLTFAFVILGSFISRSGIVESVHAFEGDLVSRVFFLALIIVSMLVILIGLFIRRDSFEASEEIESLTSKNTAYYFNNVIMMVCAILVAYLTLASALPTWMPFGGQAISTGTYDAIARPIGTLYLLLLAVCPFLSWRKTDGAEFRRNLRWPLVCALVIFAALVYVYVTRLYPIYTATLAAGGTEAAGLASEGPVWYYNGLALLALFVASLLMCDTIYLFVRGVRSRREGKGESRGIALLHLFTHSPAQSGGYLTHLGMAILLVGLVGSNMYVAETAVNLNATVGSTIDCQGYTLKLEDVITTPTSYGQIDSLTFSVTDPDGGSLGEVTPSLQSVSSTGESKLNAVVIGSPLQDLFVVYQGSTEDGSLSMDIRINPLIRFVWAGFGIMMAGTLIASLAGLRRGARRRVSREPASDDPTQHVDELSKHADWSSKLGAGKGASA